ncbi:MAG: hypothetical protein J6A20_03115 [Muribaculaceae bacterium]|nr:hypothetical protein [Muribaculaceae bacterium]
MAIDDSLSTAGVDKNRIEHLDEVVVKAKKNSKERDIYEARSKTIAYYDVVTAHLLNFTAPTIP